MRTFGVEIECMVPVAARARLCSAIVAAGVNCRDVARYHSGLDMYGWKIEADGSLRAEPGYSPLELISPPLQFDDAASFEQIEKICRVLDELDATINRSCGLHVHVGLASVPVSAVRKLAALYIEHETLIDQLIPPSRRGNANQFCRSISAANVTALTNASSIRDISHALNGDIKYSKLNLQSYWRYSTVEFRHHSGTVDAAKIIKWVGFCCKMVEAAIRDANEPITVQERSTSLPFNVHAYWRRGRRTRLIYSMLSRPEGATSEEVRVALGVRSRPSIAWHLIRAEASTTPVSRRDGMAVYRLGTVTAEAPVAPITTPATLTDLYNKLALSDDDKAFWQERAAILAAGQPRRRQTRTTQVA